jgi:Trypsin-like peptidase domain
MKHNLPSVPLFHNAQPTDPIQEMALRFVVELSNGEMYAVGTACLVCGHLAITARHVLEHAIQRFGSSRRDGPNSLEVSGYSIRLMQVLPGPIYNIWNVTTAWVTSSDIAILHFGLDGTSAPDKPIIWRAPLIRVLPPPTGEKVLAFGYRESKIQVTTVNGNPHIELNDVPTTSAGEVGQIFAERRDSAMLNFPCFEVLARFAPGMSGGMVIDEEGRLCGLVCAGTEFEDPDAPPLSYAATLWPMLTTIISGDRGDGYPRGVSYPMIDLALDNIIHALGLEYLDPKLFPGRSLPQNKE